jgi:hypothetical protein
VKVPGAVTVKVPGAVTVKVPSTVIVKNRTRLAKRGLVMRGFIAQVLHNADQAPHRDEAEAYEQQ